MHKEKWVSVGLPPELHARLAKLKAHPRQSFHEIIEQLVTTVERKK